MAAIASIDNNARFQVVYSYIQMGGNQVNEIKDQRKAKGEAKWEMRKKVSQKVHLWYNRWHIII
eukprot:scaffold502_cov147-Skeletonema_menzelii.AAC.2